MSSQPLLAGIHRYLKDSDTSWEDRIRLARFAWSSSQCFLPNKQQVLLDWVCNALANHNKLQIPDNIITILWQYFHDILHSKQLQGTTSAISVKDAIYKVLCNALVTDGAYVAMATSCCHTILKSNTLSRSLTTKYDALSELLSSFLRLVTKYLPLQHGDHQDTQDAKSRLDMTVDCLQILMKKFSVAHRQKQIQTQRKAFTGFFEKLLLPSLHLYTSDNAERYPGVLTQIEELIISGVFNKEMCEAYALYLTKTDDSAQDGKDKYLEHHIQDVASLIDFLEKQSNMGTNSTVVCGLPVLYRVFMTAYKPSADVLFAIFKKLCCIMGLTEDSGTQSDATVVCDWQHALPALESMLNIVHSNNVYMITADNTSGQLQYKWLRHLLKVVLDNADRSCVSFYKSLRILLDMNHLIVEDELTRIWNVSLLHIAKSDVDSHKVDILEESRTVFLGALMQTYVKLRQFDKLVECLLVSYKSVDSLSSDIQMTFNSGFVQRFYECIQELPPGLTLDLWKLFQDDFSTSYINPSSSSPVPASPMKKQKRMETSSPMAGREKGLELAAVTFHHFLMAARFVDLSVTRAMLFRLQTLIGDTQTKVLQQLYDMCSQHGKEQINKHLLFPTLLLTYAMGEVQLILVQHTKYGDMDTNHGDMETDDEEDHQATPDNVAVLHTIPHFREVFEGNSLENVGGFLDAYAEASGKETYRIQYLVHLLQAQQAKACLLHAPASVNTQAVMQRLSQSVFSSDVDIGHGDARLTWDGQITSITQHDYSIAYLHFLAQTMPIWLPHTTPANHHDLGRLFIQAFNTNHHQSPSRPSAGMTVQDVARAFLSSDVCLESKELQSALLVAGLTCVADLFTSTDHSPRKRKKKRSGGSITSMCGQLLHMLSDVKTDKNEDWELLENVGKQYSETLQHIQSDEDFSCTNIADSVRMVDNILNALHQLPLSHLLPSNQDRCILGLTILDTLLAAWLIADDTNTVQLCDMLIACRKMVIDILQSMKSTGILKCFNVIAMLENVISRHSQTGKLLLKTSKPHEEQLKRNYLELDDVTQKLILQWMQKVGERSTHEGSITHDIVNLMLTKLTTMESHLVTSPSPSHLYNGLSLLSTTCNVIHIEVKGHEEVKGDAERMKRISTSLQGILGSCLPLVPSDVDVDPLLIGGLAQGCIGLMMATEASSHDSSVAMETDDNKSDSVATLRKKSKDDVISTDDLWHGVIQPVLMLVLRNLDAISGRKTELVDAVDAAMTTARLVLPTCLRLMRTVCDFMASHGEVVDNEVFGRMWKSVGGLLCLTESHHLKDGVFATSSHILVSMEMGQFHKVLDNNTQTLSATQLEHHSVASLNEAVLLWQVMPNCQLTEEKLKLVEQCVPKVLTSLQCLLVEAVIDWSSWGDLSVNILKAMSAMIATDKKLLEPKQAMQSLQAILTVQFTPVPDDLFPSVFLTLYLMLKSILQAFPQPVLHSIAAYIACVQHMLRGVMCRSHQQSRSGGGIDDERLFSCAENIERLLTQIASHTKELNKSVIVIISEYISELQRGTLLPFVKKAVVVGVYNLLDVCDEKALALMQATLPVNLKEIYTEFYSDYKKYHKYQGKV